ncbi:MAG: hypothetical protein RLZZ401_222, partial [Pseudomonadota bacterium]
MEESGGLGLPAQVFDAAAMLIFYQGIRMKVQQIVVRQPVLTELDLLPLQALQPQLVLVFASLGALQQGLDAATLRAALPAAQWVGCSTAGEISRDGVTDGTVIVTGIHFDHPDFKLASVPYAGSADSAAAGRRLAAALAGPGLRHILVLGQGADINGSALVEGLVGAAGPGVTITGGLAGDAGQFTGSLVLGPDGISSQHVVAIGFYGAHLSLSHGSFGGWQPFGPARKVTRCAGNVLYELDGERALDIYKRYLGEHAAQLPASGLLFPWAMLGADHSAIGLIRTILGVNEGDGSLVLAGDVEQGGHLQLMQA